MANATAFAAEPRERAGKGGARATRRDRRVPGVIYGNKQDPLLISVDPIELMKQISSTSFFAKVYEVDVAGEKYRVLARDLQLDPVSEQPIHIDFMRFSDATRVNVEVQVVFENEDKCPGIRAGGVLNVVRFMVELKCRPDGIPETLTANLEGLEIGDSIHISAVNLPENVELTITDRDFTIATIAAPTVIQELDEEEVDEGSASAADQDLDSGSDPVEGDGTA